MPPLAATRKAMSKMELGASTEVDTCSLVARDLRNAGFQTGEIL